MEIVVVRSFLFNVKGVARVPSSTLPWNLLKMKAPSRAQHLPSLTWGMYIDMCNAEDVVVEAANMVRVSDSIVVGSLEPLWQRKKSHVHQHTANCQEAA
jgi:hypothetical protein